jgi:hypothetical protein
MAGRRTRRGWRHLAASSGSRDRRALRSPPGWRLALDVRGRRRRGPLPERLRPDRSVILKGPRLECDRANARHHHRTEPTLREAANRCATVSMVSGTVGTNIQNRRPVSSRRVASTFQWGPDSREEVIQRDTKQLEPNRRRARARSAGWTPSRSASRASFSACAAGRSKATFMRIAHRPSSPVHSCRHSVKP